MTPSTRTAIALAGTLTLASVTPGCSFIFMETAPSDHVKLAYFDCTSTYGLPVADGFIALSGVIGAASTLSQSKQDYADKNNGANRNVAAGADIALAGVLVASAVYGVVQTARCDRAKEELKARILAPSLRPPAAPPLQLPPPLPPAPTAPPPAPTPPPAVSPPPSPQPAPALSAPPAPLPSPAAPPP